MKGRSIDTLAMSGLNSSFSYYYSVLAPANLDLEKLFIEQPIKVKYHKSNPAFILTRAKYVVNALVISYNSQRRKGLAESKDAFVPLNAQLLQPYVKDYNCYLQFFVLAGIIEVGDTAIPGFRSTTYRFTAKYRNTGLRQFYIFDKGFVDSIYRKRRNNKDIQKYRYLYRTLLKLKIDWEIASEILDRLYPSKKGTGRLLQIQKLKALEDPRKATFRVGETNRLYTTISNLHADLRYALRINGKHLVSLDIKNSIPFFSTALFTKVLFNQRLDKILAELNGKISSDSGELLQWLMLVDIASREDQYDDVKLYLDQVRSGTLYEYLVEVWNELLGTSYNRKEAKKMLLKTLNSPSVINTDERLVLTAMFPHIMKAIGEINKGYNKTRYYKTKDGKRKARWRPGDQICTFAHITQMFEARVILDEICGHLASLYPQIPILTIHDSILTTPQYVDLVNRVMLEKIEAVMGYAPEISINNYDPLLWNYL